MLQKKLMILGASPFFKDAYIYAKENNLYIVAIDQRSEDVAICKKIADKAYMVSTTDLDALIKIANEEKIDGIYVGASETNMPIAMKLAEKLDLPFYANEYLWEIATNKRLFKEMCERNNVKITPYYKVNRENYKEKAKVLTYPVVTKPVDSNGSTGITICRNVEEFIGGYEHAQACSRNKDVLVEQYMDCDSTIIHYTMIKGKAYFSGMSDKISRSIQQDGAPVMALQFFPSIVQATYLEKYDTNVRNMFEQEGFKDGPIWIEAFAKNNELIFNEMGYRFGGSMSYHPVKFFAGLNQIELLINQSIGLKYGDMDYNYKYSRDKQFCIAPIHIKSGKIAKITGLEKLNQIEGFHAIAQCHVEGNTIESTGNVHQVFCYLHIVVKDKAEVNSVIDEIMHTISVIDDDENQMLFRIIE